MRSLRNNKDMVAALLSDYKPQDSSNNEEFIVASPYDTRYTNRYEGRFENNEIKR